MVLTTILKIFIYIYLTLFSWNLVAQTDSCTFSLSGTILDVETKEPIPYVSVVIQEAGKGTIANERGEFIINGLWAKG